MLNETIITGRFTDTPELKTTPSGKSVTSFTLANNTGYGDNERTNWIDCVAWNKSAENICKFFTKGSRITVVGELTTRQYEDKNGNKRKAVEVLVNKFEFMDGRKEEKIDPDPLAEVAQKIENAGFEEVDDTEDLPF